MLGMRLSALESFAKSYHGMTAALVSDAVKELTQKSQVSFCEYQQRTSPQDIGVATVMISYANNELFQDIVEALSDHLCHTPDVFVWLDIFSKSYHGQDTEVQDNVPRFKRTVIVLNPSLNVTALSSSKSLHEVYLAASQQKSGALEVAMSKANLAAVLKSPLDSFHRLLAEINIEVSLRAAPEEDQSAITANIAKNGGFTSFNHVIASALRSWLGELTESRVLDEQNIWNKLQIKFTLGTQYDEQEGQELKAEALFQECLQQWTDALRRGHPDTLAVMNRLAGLYVRQGKIEEAKKLYEDCVTIGRDRKTNQLHSTAMTAMHGLGKLLSLPSVANSTDAVTILEECLSLQKEKFGAQDQVALKTMSSLAYAYSHADSEVSKAESLYSMVYESCKSSLGDDHTKTLSALHDLSVFFAVHDKVKAVSFFAECLSRRRTVLGDHHPDTRKTLQCLAELQEHQGKIVEAKPFYEDLLRLQQFELGCDHTDCIRIVLKLVKIYEQLGDQGEKSVEMILDSWERSKRRLDCQDLAKDALNMLTILYEQSSRFDDLEALLVESLAIQKEMLGASHLDTLSTMHQLAKIQEKNKKLPQAEEQYTTCITAREKALGSDHPATKETVEDLKGMMQRTKNCGYSSYYIIPPVVVLVLILLVI